MLVIMVFQYPNQIVKTLVNFLHQILVALYKSDLVEHVLMEDGDRFPKGAQYKQVGTELLILKHMGILDMDV